MVDLSVLRVLVIDDEPTVRASLAAFLEDHDFEVTVAESAEQALSLLREAAQDVAVVDLRLPGMSGEALIQQAHLLQPALRFLIHTGSVSYRLSPALRQLGMQPSDVFQKPLNDLVQLVMGIHRLMQAEALDLPDS
jgi:DNA-binding NtrC family response regulator